MRKLDLTTALFSTIVAGFAWVPANAQNSVLTDRCAVPAPGDEDAFKDLTDCLTALEARAATLDVNIAQSAGTPQESLKAERRLTGYALVAVKSYTDAVAALRSNLKSQKDLSDRIEDPAKDPSATPAGQRVSLAAIKQGEEARLKELESAEEGLRKKAEKARPLATHYVTAISHSREDVRIDEPRSRKRSAACAQMVEHPELSLKVEKCAADAIGSFAGGSVQVPGSFLNPRGFSALLSGSEAAGTLGISYAQEFKQRLGRHEARFHDLDPSRQGRRDEGVAGDQQNLLTGGHKHRGYRRATWLSQSGRVAIPSSTPGANKTANQKSRNQKPRSLRASGSRGRTQDKGRNNENWGISIDMRGLGRLLDRTRTPSAQPRPPARD